jgi:DNA-binding response OmpR family regulator
VASDPATIVVIEDDPHIADLVELYLRRDGFRVVQASTGEAGLEACARERPRLIVLDVGLPGQIDGFEVCRRLRNAGAAAGSGSGGAQLAGVLSETPILMLTARDEEIDRVLGLEMGADDYVTKPFSPRELAARVKAVLRRTDRPPATPTVLTAGRVEVDPARREAQVDGRVVPLATREFDLLLFLAENAGLALSRQQILDGAWGVGWYGDERTVDVHVRQLRKKLGDADVFPLATVWGVGYRLG